MLIVSSVVLFDSHHAIKQSFQNTRGDNNKSTISQSADRFEEIDSDGSKDDPMAYSKWFYKQRSHGHTIPSDSYEKAVMAMHSMSNKHKNSLFASVNVASPIGGSWISVGPSPIDAGGGSFYSGRVSALASDPIHSGTIYLGAAQGGVWKSTNSGTSWSPLTDNQVSLATGSIAVDSSGNVYVGTGEGNLSCDSYYGAGILKSTDGGVTWTRLGASTFGASTITKIVINATNPNIILASTNRGVTGSSTNACTFVSLGSSLGIYRSTDGGVNWTLQKTSLGGIYDMVSNPTNTQIIYAGDNLGNGSSAIFKSTDGGISWNTLSLPIKTYGRIALGITAQPQVTVFAAVQNQTDAVLYKTIDGGSNWTLINVPIGPFGGSFCYPQCWYDIFVAPDPTTANTLYLGGLNLYRSTNGGASWTDMGGYSGNIHPDQHALAFDPTSHSHIYSGNDGGIWSATSGDTCTPSSCWTQKNTGLTITQFQSIAAHPSVGGTYFGGTQDNGSPEHTSSTTWTQLIGGDGGWSAFDPINPSTMYHTFFNISPQRSVDGGSNWIDITTSINMSDSASFYIPMSIDVTNPSILYLGTDHLYKTINKGDSWSLTGLSVSSIFSAIKIAPSDDNFVYTGTSDGQFYASTNGGTSFTEHDTGLPSVFLTQIAVDPTNPQKVYATFSGTGGSHVFVSSNAGTTWTNITSDLPNTPTNTILVKNGNIFVGTDIGPFVSTNDGTNWVTLGTGFPTVSIFDMAITADGKLLTATHGRGAWTLDVTNLPSCVPLTSPSDIITTCTLSSNTTVPGDVIVESGVTLTIPNGVTLNIDFTSHHLLVKSGGKVIIQPGGKIS